MSAIVWVSAAVPGCRDLWRDQSPGWFRRSLATVASLLYWSQGVLGRRHCFVAELGTVRSVQLPPRFRAYSLGRTDGRSAGTLAWAATLMNPDAIGNYQTFDMSRSLQMGTDATTPRTSDLRPLWITPQLAASGCKRSDARTLG